MIERKTDKNKLLCQSQAIEGEVITLPFRKGDIVTRTGRDIQRVTICDQECYYGEFTCLYDDGDIYDIGDTEANMCYRYERITKEGFYSDLYAIALRHGWVRA